MASLSARIGEKSYALTPEAGATAKSIAKQRVSGFHFIR